MINKLQIYVCQGIDISRVFRVESCKVLHTQQNFLGALSRFTSNPFLFHNGLFVCIRCEGMSTQSMTELLY